MLVQIRLWVYFFLILQLVLRILQLYKKLSQPKAHTLYGGVEGVGGSYRVLRLSLRAIVERLETKERV